MDDIFQCPECDTQFKESEATVLLRHLNYSKGDDAIQSTSLVYCPECGDVVLAIFDSMTIK